MKKKYIYSFKNKTMPKRLTLPEQRRLYQSLPAHRKKLVEAAILKNHKGDDMKGAGLMDMVKSVGKALGHVAKEIGPVVIKEIVSAVIRNKMSGKGITLPGGALKLAGQGHYMNKGRAKKYKK